MCWGDSPDFGACAGELVCLGGRTHLILAPVLENLCVWGGDSPDFGSYVGELVCWREGLT